MTSILVGAAGVAFSAGVIFRTMSARSYGSPSVLDIDHPRFSVDNFYAATLFLQVKTAAFTLASSLLALALLLVFASNVSPLFLLPLAAFLAAGLLVGPRLAPNLPVFANKIRRVEFGCRAEFDAAHRMLRRPGVQKVVAGYRPVNSGSDCDLAVILRSGKLLCVEVKGTRWGRLAHRNSLLVAGKPVFGSPIRQVLNTCARLERFHKQRWTPVVVCPYASGALTVTLNGERPVIVLGGDQASTFPI